MKYRKRPKLVDAYQWFKHGDRPDDGKRTVEGAIVRYFRSPDVPGDSSCDRCGGVMHVHGWIDQPDGGLAVCPGDFLVFDPASRTWRAMAAEAFAAAYVKDHEHTI